MSLPEFPAVFGAATIWADLFVSGLPLVEKMIRPVLVYAALVVGLRVFGKRELAQLNPFDFVVLMSLANTVQNAIIGDEASVTGGLVGAFTLLSVNYLVVRFLFSHRRLDQLIAGKPTLLIDNGRILRKNMAKELITKSELLMVLHRQGFARLEDVDRCELEPGGTFAITASEPSRGERTHAELLARLDDLARRLEAMDARLGPAPRPDAAS